MDVNNLVKQTVLKTIFLIAFCFAIFSTTQAQINQAKDEPFDSPKNPITCDDWRNYIAGALRRWDKNKDASFIIIARLGDGEYSRQINLKRIRILKGYIEYISNPKVKIKAVFAEGERVEGLGVIELYVEGKLLYSLPISKKEDVPLKLCPTG